MSERTPNYVLTEEHQWWQTKSEIRRLDAGAFVRPIELCYVPKHVTEKHLIFNEEREIYCYTRYGIVPIPRKSIRQV